MSRKITYIACTIILIFFQVVLSYAQPQILITGKVTDTDGLGLPTATVVELDRNNRIVKGVITDFNGVYALQISSVENKIQFSFIGYETKEEIIGNRKVINITLDESSEIIDDIVITADKRTNTGFMNIKDRDLSVPVSKMSTKDIEDIQASSIDEVMQGRLAGVDIVSNSGDPGGGMSIRIRGVSSLSANDRPLIVVDNIPYETSISGDFDFANENEEGYAQMLNIAVDDISEIAVLKDAAATSVWGTKGANGVLLITTKRGSRGQKPVLSYTFRGTFSEQPTPIPLLNGDQYSTLISEAAMNRDGIPLNTVAYKEFQYDPNDPYWYHNYSQNTDWVGAIQRNGFTQNHDISLSGGGSKVMYRLSANIQDQQGVIIGTDLKKLSTRLNLDYFISDKIRLRADFSYSHSDNRRDYMRKFGRNTIDWAYRKMPNMSIYEYDELGNITPNYFSPANNAQGYFNGKSSGSFNPLAMVENGLYKVANNRITSKFAINYKILTGLEYRAEVSFDISNDKTNSFLPQTATGLDWTNRYVNLASDGDADSYSIYTSNTLSYNTTLGEDHVISVLFNVNTNDNRSLYYLQEATNGASSYLQDPSISAKTQTSIVGMKSSIGVTRRNGILGSLNYIFRDKYILSGSLRREGNSKFYKDYRYAYFPALSAAWRLSNEDFMSGLGWLNDLRIKGSYGENGHEPRYAYSFFNNYNTFSWDYLGKNAVYPVDMQLENLQWEKFITYNAGISAELFDSRLVVEFDMYKNRTYNMFGSSTVSSVSGFEGVPTNIGTLDAQGWDFNLRSTPVKTKDWTVTFDFNVAHFYNVLREIADNYSLTQGTATNGKYTQLIQINNPIGAFYGFIYEGVYTSEEALVATDANGNKIYDPAGNPINMRYRYPSVDYEFQQGDAKYADINNDGNIDDLDVVYLGNANPDFTGGFGSTIKYKNFKVNLFFHGRYGNEVINTVQIKGENMFGFDNQTTSVLKRWRNPGDETDVPRALLGYGYNWLGSDRFVGDGSFLRLKYLTFTYDFSTEFSRKLGMQDIKISTTFNNLLTFTNYLGQDPEITIKSNDGSIFTVGYDYSNTPKTRDVTFNLSLKF